MSLSNEYCFQREILTLLENINDKILIFLDKSGIFGDSSISYSHANSIPVVSPELWELELEDDEDIIIFGPVKQS